MDVSAPLLTTYWQYFMAVVVGILFSQIMQRVSKNASEKHRPRPNQNVLLDTNKQGIQVDSDDDTTSEYLPPDNLDKSGHIPYVLERYSNEEIQSRSTYFYEEMNKRRSVRFYSDEPVPWSVIENVVRVAGTAPSGAHTQPWMFVVVSDPETKSKIQQIVEDEELMNYEKRMGKQWLQDLARINTTWKKPYIKLAPYIIVVFKKVYGLREDGTRTTNYYHELSSSISVGFLLAAIQYAGLVSLTTTPMNAGPRLRELLGRPVNEKVILLLPVGFPSADATVPDLKRKPLNDIMIKI